VKTGEGKLTKTIRSTYATWQKMFQARCSWTFGRFRSKFYMVTVSWLPSHVPSFVQSIRSSRWCWQKRFPPSLRYC